MCILYIILMTDADCTVFSGVYNDCEIIRFHDKNESKMELIFLFAVPFSLLFFAVVPKMTSVQSKLIFCHVSYTRRS